MASPQKAVVRPAVRPELVQLTNESLAYIVTTEEQWEAALVEFKEALGVRNFIGLDVEYLMTTESQPKENRSVLPDVPNDPVRIKNVQQGRDPLLQLGTRGLAILVRLCYFEKLPQSLSDLLENKDIAKLGVEIQDDVQRLKVYWRLRVRCFVDLRFVCLASPQFTEAYHFRAFSLKSIGAFLGQEIFEERDWRIAASNWAAPRLTHQQVEYAANDALAASGSYEVLVTQFQAGSKCKHSPKERAFWEYFWEKRFQRFANRAFHDNALSKYLKKSDEIPGGQRSLESRIHTGDIRPKQYKKMEEQLHNSDSELDCDFEQEKRKKMATLPPITYVEFYPDDKRNGKNEQSESAESQDATEVVSSGNTTTCSVCASSEFQSGTKSLFGMQDSAYRLFTQSSASSRSISVSDSEALISVSESKLAEKVESKGDDVLSHRTDTTELETEDTDFYSSEEDQEEEYEQKKTEKTETSGSFSADGPFLGVTSSQSAHSSGFAADVSAYSELSKSYKEETRMSEKPVMMSGEIGEGSIDNEGGAESVGAGGEKEGKPESKKTGKKKKLLKAPLLIEKDLLDWCINAEVPALTLTVVSDISGTKHHYRVKIEDVELVDDDDE